MALCISTHTAHAQRTANGSVQISTGGSYIFAGTGSGAGADLSCGQYLLGSYWDAGLSCSLCSIPLTSSEQLQYSPVLLFGEWLYRLAGTRGRALNLYAGGGCFLGTELHDPFGRLPSHIETGFAARSFIYGIHTKMEVELFFCRNAAVTIGASLPVSFSSPVSIASCHIGAGLRLNLK